MRLFVFRIVPIVVIVWLLGDLIYSRIVAARLAAWEQTVDRDENGVQRGHAEYSIGDGDTGMLLVHGINFSPYVYRNLAPRLAEQGIFCRVMRLPGFALPIPDYARARRSEWVAAVAEELAALRATHKRVVLVAHSLGAAVAIRTLLERQPDVDGVVLLAPAIEVSAARSPLGIPTRFWHEFAKYTLVFTQIAWSPFTYDLNDPEALQEIPQQPFTPRSIVQQTFELIDANRGQAVELKYPLRMIVSPNDKIIDTAAAVEFYERWGGADKQLIRQERAAHMIPLDFDWQQVADAIAEFAHDVDAGAK